MVYNRMAVKFNVALKGASIMKLEATQKVKHEQNVQRGKRAKRKGGNYERVIAKKFGDRYGVELKRTPQSGGFAKKSEKADDYRGDITIVDTKQMLLLHIECKDHKTISLKRWIKQSEEDCPEGRIPVVIFHRFGTSKNYVALKSDTRNSLCDELFNFKVYDKTGCKQWKLLDWLDEAERDSHTRVIRKFPSLLIDYEGVNYEVVLLDDFLKAVPKDRVVGKRVFN